jgi:zinc transport system substrate-binding protein
MRALILFLVIPALLFGCGADPAPPAGDGRLAVAVTLHPIASLVREVGGDAVEVRTLLPPGAHPDSYEATPRMAQALAGADLVVRVGGAVDDWLGERGREEHLVLTRGMTLKGTAHHHGPARNARSAGTGNPHVWLDPILVRDTLLPLLVDALAERDPASADQFRARAAAFADSLTALDAEIRGLLAHVTVRHFVSAHPAWVYFADRYDLEEIGSLHPSPGSEVGARELARLVTEARRRGGAAVIGEPQVSRAGVDAMAKELGVDVALADPEGGAGLAERENYLSLMRFNARVFARALAAAGS